MMERIHFVSLFLFQTGDGNAKSSLMEGGGECLAKNFPFFLSISTLDTARHLVCGCRVLLSFVPSAFFCPHLQLRITTPTRANAPYMPS